MLAVRRFFCPALACPRKTFAEQVNGLTERYARKTPLLAGMLGDIAVALAGRAGSRLAACLGVPARCRHARPPCPACGMTRHGLPSRYIYSIYRDDGLPPTG